MSGLLGILIVILIIWRLYTIFKMIATPDFWVGLAIDFLLLVMIDHYCSSGSSRPSKVTILALIVFCIIFAFFKNKLIPRNLRRPFSLPVSTGVMVLSSVVMGVFIFLWAAVNYHTSLDKMAVIVPVCWLFGLLLMLISNSARVPWLVLTNICLLGLLAYNATNDGKGGREDGGYDGFGGDYSADLPDDSIWANISFHKPVIDTTPDIGITDFDLSGNMIPGADLTLTAAPAFTPLDTWGSFSLSDTSFATDIPPFADNPYMALSTGAGFNDNFQICDANGMPELTIADGNIFNSENIITGHISYDPTLHMTTYTDAANMPYMHVDQANNIYTADDCYIGHYSDSGNIRTVFDAKGGIAYRLDKLTNTIFGGKDSSIIGKIIKS